MKKIFLFVLSACLCITGVHSQLVVDSLGRVGIGTDAPKARLTIGTDSDTLSTMFCQTSNKTYGIYSKNNYNFPDNSTVSIYSITQNHTGDSYGERAIAIGNNNMNSSKRAIGVNGCASSANTSIGLLGGRLSGGAVVNFAGVYGCESGTTPSFTNYSGTYAGYFKGKVRVTNGIYATLLSPSANASPSGQNGTTILSERGESVTDKLAQVQTLQFLRYEPTQEENTAKPTPIAFDIDNMSPEELDSLAKNAEEEPERYLSAVQYGLAADQLKAVYPELVYKDANGNISINYVEMVPLLVQSINELSQELAELKGTASRRAKAETTGIENNVSDIDMVRMDQNKPNPFSESTVIGLNIPEKTQKADIFIYDLSGKQIQNVPVAERGETNITVYASELGAGMYIYTLVVDGKVVVTRRMIVEL